MARGRNRMMPEPESINLTYSKKQETKVDIDQEKKQREPYTKVKKEDTKLVTFKLPVSLIEQIDEHCAAESISRTEFFKSLSKEKLDI